MKNLFYLSALALMFIISSCGNSGKNLPENIKNAFTEKFPNATDVKWDMENASEWEAEFKMDGKEYSANFDIKGAWMETEYAIEKSDIPEVVKTSIETDFPEYSIEVSEVSETADGKVFEFELKKGSDVLEVSMDMEGKTIKKEEVKDEEEDKD